MSLLPGLGSFRPTLKEVATALRIAPGEGAGVAAGPSALEAQQLAAVQDVRSAPNARAAAQWRAGTAAPGADGDACETALGTSSCERVLIGPAEITSLVAGGGCPSRLMIFAGDAQKPRWSIVVPAGGTLALASTSIPLEDSEKLGVATTSGGALQAECAVTWVARRR